MRSICRQLGWWTLSIVLSVPLSALGDEADNETETTVEVVNVANVVVAPAAQPAPAQPQAPAAKAEKPKPPVVDPTLSMLYLGDDDYFAGTLRDNPNPNTIRWQATGATEPFEFSPEAVRSAYFAPPAVRPLPEGEYCIELTDGDILYGNLAAITKDE